MFAAVPMQSPRTDVSDTIITRAYLPMDTYTRLRAVTRTISGATMTRIIRDGLAAWLKAEEAKAFTCKVYGGVTIHKAPGDPFPPRQSDIRKGRPVESSAKDTRQVSFRLDPDFHERLYNAIAWQQAWLSHVVDEAVAGQLDELE